MKFLIGIVFYVALTLASCYQCPPPELVRPCKCTDEDGLTLQCWNLTNKSTLEDITRRTGKIHFKKLYVFQSTLPLSTKFLLQKQIQSLDLVESNFTSNFLDVNHNRYSKISNLSFNSTNNHSLPNSPVKYSMQNSILYHLQPNSTVNDSLPNPILRNSSANSTMQHSLPISTLHPLLQNSAVQLPLPNSTVHPSLSNSTVQTSLDNPKIQQSLVNSTVQHSSKNPKIQHSVVNSTVQHSSKNPKVDHSLTKKKAHHSKKKHLNSLTIEAVHLYDNTFTNGISWRQFLELRHLRFLLAYKVDITHLDYSFRLYVSKTLERLHLWRTGTVYLEEKVLEEFPALIDVRIQECMLTELKRSYFARPAKIQIMYFDGN
ncbi:hypothetical protein JTE90_010626 [Oedothorax gibbosus]|uniref:Uncharacterized protein n=1 Tax=Oedothorax gibbosus TaxID=931172 RepID=A0AAV6VHZ9_9ARAC|nr:hypothetical protein JTE90_010626 [Oedothorax gibbosus]